MASQYSPSLKITLMGDGDQAGLWGQTTNINLGTLLEQAITGVTSITMSDANYTLTSFNGISDEARNAVLVVTGTNNAQRDLIPPVVEKLYTVVNNTTGGYAIRVIGASGTGVIIPNGATCLVYCDGTNFVNGLSGSAGNFSVAGNVSVTGTITGNVSATNITASANLASANASFSGTVTAPTAANGTNNTVVATTAFVNAAVTAVSSTLGTMATQNANNVSITGGSITGITDLAVADGGTGQSSYTDGQLLIGNSSGNTLTKATLTAGSGVSITNGAGAITIASTAISASSNTPTSGYITLANGTIMQWGQVTGTASSQSISYPIVFPTNVVSITAQFASTGSTGTSSWAVNSYTTSGFVFVTGNPGQTTFWFAVGY